MDSPSLDAEASSIQEILKEFSKHHTKEDEKACLSEEEMKQQISVFLNKHDLQKMALNMLTHVTLNLLHFYSVFKDQTSEFPEKMVTESQGGFIDDSIIPSFENQITDTTNCALDTTIHSIEMLEVKEDDILVKSVFSRCPNLISILKGNFIDISPDLLEQEVQELIIGLNAATGLMKIRFANKNVSEENQSLSQHSILADSACITRQYTESHDSDFSFKYSSLHESQVQLSLGEIDHTLLKPRPILLDKESPSVHLAEVLKERENLQKKLHQNCGFISGLQDTNTKYQEENQLLKEKLNKLSKELKDSKTKLEKMKGQKEEKKFSPQEARDRVQNLLTCKNLETLTKKELMERIWELSSLVDDTVNDSNKLNESSSTAIADLEQQLQTADRLLREERHFLEQQSIDTDKEFEERNQLAKKFGIISAEKETLLSEHENLKKEISTVQSDLQSKLSALQFEKEELLKKYRLTTDKVKDLNEIVQNLEDKLSTKDIDFKTQAKNLETTLSELHNERNFNKNLNLQMEDFENRHQNQLLNFSSHSQQETLYNMSGRLKNGKAFADEIETLNVDQSLIHAIFSILEKSTEGLEEFQISNVSRSAASDEDCSVRKSLDASAKEKSISERPYSPSSVQIQLEEKSKSFQKAFDGLKKYVKDIEMRNTLLNDMHDEIGRERDELEQKLKSSDEKVTSLREEFNSANQRFTSLQATNVENSHLLTQLETIKSCLEKENSEQLLKISRLEADLGDLKRIHFSIAEKNLRQRFISMQEDLQGNIEKLSRKCSENEELKYNVKDLTEKLLLREEELEKINQEVIHLQSLRPETTEVQPVPINNPSKAYPTFILGFPSSWPETVPLTSIHKNLIKDDQTAIEYTETQEEVVILNRKPKDKDKTLSVTSQLKNLIEKNEALETEKEELENGKLSLIEEIVSLKQTINSLREESNLQIDALNRHKKLENDLTSLKKRETTLITELDSVKAENNFHKDALSQCKIVENDFNELMKRKDLIKEELESCKAENISHKDLINRYKKVESRLIELEKRDNVMKAEQETTNQNISHLLRKFNIGDSKILSSESLSIIEKHFDTSEKLLSEQQRMLEQNRHKVATLTRQVEELTNQLTTKDTQFDVKMKEAKNKFKEGIEECKKNYLKEKQLQSANDNQQKRATTYDDADRTEALANLSDRYDTLLDRVVQQKDEALERISRNLSIDGSNVDSLENLQEQLRREMNRASRFNESLLNCFEGAFSCTTLSGDDAHKTKTLLNKVLKEGLKLLNLTELMFLQNHPDHLSVTQQDILRDITDLQSNSSSQGVSIPCPSPPFLISSLEQELAKRQTLWEKKERTFKFQIDLEKMLVKEWQKKCEHKTKLLAEMKKIHEETLPTCDYMQLQKSINDSQLETLLAENSELKCRLDSSQSHIADLEKSIARERNNFSSLSNTLNQQRKIAAIKERQQTQIIGELRKDIDQERRANLDLKSKVVENRREEASLPFNHTSKSSSSSSFSESGFMEPDESCKLCDQLQIQTEALRRELNCERSNQLSESSRKQIQIENLHKYIRDLESEKVALLNKLKNNAERITCLEVQNSFYLSERSSSPHQNSASNDLTTESNSMMLRIKEKEALLKKLNEQLSNIGIDSIEESSVVLEKDSKIKKLKQEIDLKSNENIDLRASLRILVDDRRDLLQKINDLELTIEKCRSEARTHQVEATRGPLEAKREECLFWKVKKNESQLKALVFQKEYLLSVIRAIQNPENVSLKRLRQFASVPDNRSKTHLSPLVRFRCVAFCVMSLERMKLLVNRWKVSNRIQITSSVTTIVRAGSDELQPQPRTSIMESSFTGATPPTKDNCQPQYQPDAASKRILFS